MSLDVSVEIKARLEAKAREQGLSIDAFLERLLNEGSDPKTPPGNGEAPVLPARYLGIKGSLRRCEIYNEID